MTTICRERIDTPAAWTKASIGGLNGLAIDLTADQIAALDRAVVRTRHLGAHDVTRGDFSDPTIQVLAARIEDAIRHGSGAVLLRGLSRGTHSEADMERIFWGLGVHLGEPVQQSMLGDRIGHVRHVKDDPVARGYRSNEELSPHTDSYRVAGLMCLQRAESGGLSRLVSSLAVHNAILAERPDLLEPLYEGYYYAVAEARFSADPVTDFKIPVFCCVDGAVSCGCSRGFMHEAARLRGEELPPKLLEALDYFDATAQSNDIGLHFLLEPGQILLWHNFQMLHARDAYQDSPARTRHLLRLWLHIENDRPIAGAILERAKVYERVFREQSGRVPASAMA